MSRESAIFFLYLSEKVLKARGFDPNSAGRSSSSLIPIGGFSPGNLIFVGKALILTNQRYRIGEVVVFYWKLLFDQNHGEIFPGSPHSQVILVSHIGGILGPSGGHWGDEVMDNKESYRVQIAPRMKGTWYSDRWVSGSRVVTALVLLCNIVVHPT